MENKDYKIPDTARAALERGNKIEAIKLSREAFNLGLQEAKELVESHLAADQGLNMRYLSESKKNSSGCLPLIAVILGLAAIMFGIAASIAYLAGWNGFSV